MHKHGRLDANHKEIVAALRQAGATVQSLADVGNGCVDVLAGYREVNYLLEIKSPGGKLTPDEAKWHQAWGGTVYTVYSAEEALKAIGAITE